MLHLVATCHISKHPGLSLNNAACHSVVDFQSHYSMDFHFMQNHISCKAELSHILQKKIKYKKSNLTPLAIKE